MAPPMGPHGVPMGPHGVRMGAYGVLTGSPRGPHRSPVPLPPPMSPHGVPMNPYGYDLSFVVPAFVQPSVTRR